MRKQVQLFLVSFLLLFSFKSIAQHKDSAASGFLVELSYAGQLPGGNLTQIFGFNSNIQGGAYYKTKKNWIYGASFAFLFGNILSNAGILDSISTTSGNLIADDGNYPGISYFERGFDIQLTIGKLFPVSRNLNSGILTTFSAGYIQHHVDIEVNDNTPQLDGDYLNGYDHLTAGICATEFIGYQYMSKKLFLAFFAGFEFTEAFSKSLRYDFELRAKDPNYKYEMLSGFRVGWILPILQEHTLKFYTH